MTPVLLQKLRIRQTSAVAYNFAFGVGLDPTLRVRNLRFETRGKRHAPPPANIYIYIYIYIYTYIYIYILE